MTARPLSELVEQGWAAALHPVADQVAQMGQFLRAEIAAGRKYLPAGRMCCAPSRFLSTRCGC
ncbi:uracil-DNA glycosylase domain protein [Mycobacterium kansasii]|uniref:Uracil-DNA glycosylase domain protein n=1 Tax=Mycobacterium kansasii TaxID=1768 RepID=A0A1V3XUF5_MYCKA|nr:uracil-DNA glycosylase domain protein [Mycobacterium kansasii]